VKVEDIRYVLKVVKQWEVGSKGIRETNGRSGTDQSKVYPQWGYTEKSL
jgi:hypothetical protein